MAAFSAYAIGGLGRGSVDGLFLTWINSGISFAAAAICIARGKAMRHERRAWIVLALAIASSATGDVLYSLLYNDVKNPPFPTIADAFYLAFYPGSYVALMLLLRARVRRFHASMWVDGIVAGLGLAAIAAVAFQPILLATGGSVAAVATNLAYPLGDLLLLAMVVATFAFTGWRPGRAWLALGTGLAVGAVADTIYLEQIAKGTYVAGHAVDVLWPLSNVLLAFAAWQRPRDGRSELAGWSILVAPALFTASSLALLVLDHFHAINLVALGAACGSLVAALIRITLTFRDVRSLAETRRLAMTDDLTDLPNRRALFARIDEWVQTAGADHQLSLLVIGLERVKEINNALGRDAGDALIRRAGERLRDFTGDHGFVARIDGDEFAVIVLGGVERAVQEANAVRAALQQPLELHGVAVLVDGSVGIASHPDHGSDALSLLQRGELALERATSGGFGVQTYAAQHTEAASRERIALAGELGRALDNAEIEVWYQPIASLVTGRVAGVEALVRWRHPSRGLVNPAVFLPLIEQTRLIKPLTRLVLASALAQCAEWRVAGLDLFVAVNLSAANLIDSELPAEVRSLAQAHRLDPAAVHLEVTESLVMADPDRAVETLRNLRALGASVALDDFGTGYSSLGYLKNLPVDELKLDRSFVADVASNARDAAIVRSTVQLAQAVNMRTVAEGVETEDAWRVLRDIGCDYAQGYLLSRPAPASELTGWIAARIAADAHASDAMYAPGADVSLDATP